LPSDWSWTLRFKPNGTKPGTEIGDASSADRVPRHALLRPILFCKRDAHASFGHSIASFE